MRVAVDGSFIKVYKQLSLYIAITGGLVQGLAASQFTPPYSNDQYSCRCFPLIHESDNTHRSIPTRAQALELHHKMCELRTYIQALGSHMQFFKELFEGQTDVIAAWFKQVGRDAGMAFADQIRGFITNHRSSYDKQYIQCLEEFEQELRMDPQKASHSSIIMKLQADNRVMNRELRGFLSFFGWLFGMADSIEQEQVALKTDVWVQFEGFPFEKVEQKVHSGVLCGALKDLDEKHSFDSLWACWKALAAFAHSEGDNSVQADIFDTVFAADIVVLNDIKLTDLEKKITCAFIGVKDLANLIYILHSYTTHKCIVAQIDKDYPRLGLGDFLQHNAVFDLFAIYSAIDNLRIDKMLDEISRTVKGFFKALNKLQQEANESFVGWLQSKWLLMPIAVGVVIVKIVQYFLVKDVSSSIFSSRLNSDDDDATVGA